MSDETRAVRTIGRYHAVDELGRGAMGIVYRGFDPVIGRTVALKTIGITAEGAEAKTLRERLYREASAAGTLTHPNIVTIYDVIEDGATTAVAMEFVEGQTLADLLEKSGPLTVDRALELFDQIASALDYAGSKGIVHRDIKPANILLTADGRAKVTDFGIARIALAGLTQTGTIMGSPSYMSPEQIRGVPLDPRSDLFSAAVVLFEMLTGSRPFGGDDVATTMYRIVNEPPPAVEQINAAIHPAVSAVLARALAKDPQERFQTGAELVAELKRCLGQGAPSLSMPMPSYVPETAPAPPARRPMGLIIGGVAAVVIVVAAIGIIFGGGGTTDATPATQTASGVEIANREVQQPVAPPADAARARATGPVSTVPPPPPNAPVSTIPTPPTRLTGPVSTMPPLVLNEAPTSSTPPARAGGAAPRPEATSTPPAADTRMPPARPPDLPPARTTPPRQEAEPPARTPPPKDPEPPARPPEAPAAEDATVRVDFDGAAYAVTLMAGDERLGRVDTQGQALSVEPGTVRLRAVNEAFFLNLDLGTVTLRAGERKTVVIPGTASAVFNVKGEDYTGVRVFIDGRQVPGPYPAQIGQIAAGPHAVVYRWMSGPMAGREITKTVTLGARGHFLVRAVIDNGDIVVQQLR